MYKADPGRRTVVGPLVVVLEPVVVLVVVVDGYEQLM